MNNDRNDKIDFKRRERGLNERILLLETVVTENEISNDILSQTNSIYNIIIDRNTLSVRCNCMDFINRKKTCKHIYWLGQKKLGEVNPYNWSFLLLDHFIKNNRSDISDTLHKTKRGRNEECMICLENIDYDNEYTFICEKSCKNSTHLVCWNRYTRISKNFNCVMCRTIA